MDIDIVIIIIVILDIIIVTIISVLPCCAGASRGARVSPWSVGLG